jgi:SPP1 family predicted phage head-tail adaptor
VLSASSLSRARAVADQFLSGEVTLLTKSRTQDGIGGKTKAYADGATIPARLVPYDVAELSESERVAGVQFYHLYVAHDAELTAKQDLRYDGEIYRIEGLMAPHSGDKLHLCAKVAKIDGD